MAAGAAVGAEHLFPVTRRSEPLRALGLGGPLSNLWVGRSKEAGMSRKWLAPTTRLHDRGLNRRLRCLSSPSPILVGMVEV
jgi:hypothetical protein